MKAHCLDEILAAYHRAISTRKHRSEKGKEAAEERRAHRMGLVQKLRDELEVFEDALVMLEEEVQQEFVDLSRELDVFDEEVIAAIQEKVGGEDTDMFLDKPPDPILEQHRQETAKSLKKLEVAAKEADERAKGAEMKAKAAQQEAETLKEQVAAISSKEVPAAATAAAGVVTDVQEDLDPELLPLVPPPAPAALPVLDRAWHILQQVRWVSNVQVSFELLGLPMDDYRQLVGVQWQEVYPQKQPLGADAIPPCLLALTAQALERLGEQLAERGQEDREESARKAKEAVQLAKKRRQC